MKTFLQFLKEGQLNFDTSPWEIANGDLPSKSKVDVYKFGLDFVPTRPNDWKSNKIVDFQDTYSNAVKLAMNLAKSKNVKILYLLP